MDIAFEHKPSSPTASTAVSVVGSDFEMRMCMMTMVL